MVTFLAVVCVLFVLLLSGFFLKLVNHSKDVRDLLAKNKETLDWIKIVVEQQDIVNDAVLALATSLARGADRTHDKIEETVKAGLEEAAKKTEEATTKLVETIAAGPLSADSGNKIPAIKSSP